MSRTEQFTNFMQFEELHSFLPVYSQCSMPQPLFDQTPQNDIITYTYIRNVFIIKNNTKYFPMKIGINIVMTIN